MCTCADLFVKALTQAKDDESFHLQTVEASRALKIARSILETVPCSMIAIETLSAYLVDSLNTCIRYSTLTYGDQQLSVNRQVLWSGRCNIYIVFASDFRLGTLARLPYFFLSKFLDFGRAKLNFLPTGI